MIVKRKQAEIGYFGCTNPNLPEYYTVGNEGYFYIDINSGQITFNDVPIKSPQDIKRNIKFRFLTVNDLDDLIGLDFLENGFSKEEIKSYLDKVNRIIRNVN